MAIEKRELIEDRDKYASTINILLLFNYESKMLCHHLIINLLETEIM